MRQLLEIKCPDFTRISLDQTSAKLTPL